MIIEFSGKTALVTGSTSGIGFAIAQGLVQAGASVIINGRSREQTASAASRLGGSVRAVAADLATAEGCAALVRAEPAADIAVSNLGIFKAVIFSGAMTPCGMRTGKPTSWQRCGWPGPTCQV